MRVFGYGSLVVPGAEPHVLRGWRRTWGVAMDNRVDLPAYKHYVDPVTGERPAVFVAFLDLVPDAGAETVGTLLDAPDLATLDRRERQYERVEVEPGVVAYVGRPEARERFARGVRDGTAVVTRGYLALLPAGTPEPPVPIQDLSRTD